MFSPIFTPTLRKLTKANFLAFSFNLRLANGIADIASIPTIKLNQIMYSACSGYLSKLAILRKNVANNMNMDEVVVNEKEY